MTNGNEPINYQLDWGNQGAKIEGLTKREYFASMAMQGLMSTLIPSEQYPNLGNVLYMASLSATAADALINALNEPSC